MLATDTDFILLLLQFSASLLLDFVAKHVRFLFGTYCYVLQILLQNILHITEYFK